MKFKALMLALFTAGLAVSIAVAASPAAVEKGKPTVATGTDGTTTHESRGKSDAKKAAECNPARKILLKGEFVAPGAGGFAMKVTGGNHAANAWKGKQATVLVDDKTKFKGKKRALAAFVAGDRLAVQGNACKADAVAGSVLARMVMSKGAKNDEDAENKTTTTAVTTTTP